MSTHHHAPSGRAGVGHLPALLIAICVAGTAAAAVASTERPLPITQEALREGSGVSDGRAAAMRAIEHLRAGDLPRAERELVRAGAAAPGAAETWAARERLLSHQTPWDLPERLETYRALWGSLSSDPAAALALRSYGFRYAAQALTLLGAVLSIGLAASAARCFHVDLRRASAHLLRAVIPRAFPWLLCASAAVVTGSSAVGLAGAAGIGALYLQGFRRLFIPIIALCFAVAPLLSERADRLDGLVAAEELYALRTIGQRCDSKACRDSLRAASASDPTGASGVALARALRMSTDPEDQAEAARLLASPARLASLQRFASGEALSSTPTGLTAAWLSEAMVRSAEVPASGARSVAGLGGSFKRLGGWLLGAFVLQAGLLALFLRRDRLLSGVCSHCGAVCTPDDLRPPDRCHLCDDEAATQRDAEQRAVALHRPIRQHARAAWSAAVGDLLFPGLGGMATKGSLVSFLLVLLASLAVTLLLAPAPWWPTTEAAMGLLRGAAWVTLVLVWLIMLARLVRLLRSGEHREAA